MSDFVSDAFDLRLQLRFEGGPLDSVDLLIEFERKGPRTLGALVWASAQRTFGWNADEWPDDLGHYELTRQQDADGWAFRWKGREPS